VNVEQLKLELSDLRLGFAPVFLSYEYIYVRLSDEMKTGNLGISEGG